MTSTSVNIGFFNEKKTSRVLKPPGGGHSQIFGGADEEKPRSYKPKQTSSIGECFMNNDDVKQPENGHNGQQKEEIVEKPVNGLKTEQNNENGEKTDTNTEKEVEVEKEVIEEKMPEESKPEEIIKEEEVKEEVKKDVVQTPQRVRVPPGGFSSGFW